MVQSATVIGIDARPVEIEVDLAPGLARTVIVGLPDGAVRESRDRVRAALDNCGYRYPSAGQLTINLAPASVRKAGPMYDLPIAIGILAATGQLVCDGLADVCLVGELALDGRLRPVRGVLPIAGACRQPRLVVPWDNGAEAAVAGRVEVIAAKSLHEVVDCLTGRRAAEPPVVREHAGKPVADFSEVVGQPQAKYALLVAAAGGHNVLLCGPPGVGKSMLACRLPGILGPLSDAEALETSRIYSVCGLLPGDGLLRTPPFRAPHHTVSRAGLIGGGNPLQPGEVSLAHNGVLFLDEAPEFCRANLDALRQPLEQEEVPLVRVGRRVAYPARFQLVLALNPCPCGYHASAPERCRCSPRDVERYVRRLSGPLLDRIDIQIQLDRVDPAALGAGVDPEGSSDRLRARVLDARRRQRARYGGDRTNGRVSDALLRASAAMTEDARICLAVSAGQREESARGYYRTVRLARTVADLEGSAGIEPDHVLQALMLRCNPLDG